MNQRLRALLGRKDSVRAAAEAISNAAAAADRELTVAEQKAFDGHMLSLKQINEDIRREQEGIEAERNAPALRGDRLARASGFPTYLDDRAIASIPTGRRYAQMFPGASLDANGFAGVGEFFAVLRSGMPDPRLIMAAASGGSEGSGVDGGYSVPVQFLAEMLDQSLEDEIVRPRASVRPMTSNSVFVPGFDMLDHSSNIGGFDAKWVAEGSAFNFQKAKFRGMQLKVSKLGVLTSGTNELLADSAFYERELPELMVRAITFGLDEAFLTGNGVGMPLGVLNDKALITVSKEVGQAADTIVWENMKKMFARLHPQSKKRAVWVVSHTAQVQLLSLIQFVKNVAATENVGGTWIPVMREEDGKFFILGLEVIFTEKLPVVGDKGDILLADFSQYFVGLRGDMSIDKSGHVLFTTDETAFRGILRADGQGRWNAPMKPRNGGANDTMSWCVTLEAR